MLRPFPRSSDLGVRYDLRGRRGASPQVHIRPHPSLSSRESNDTVTKTGSGTSQAVMRPLFAITAVMVALLLPRISNALTCPLITFAVPQDDCSHCPTQEQERCP